MRLEEMSAGYGITLYVTVNETQQLVFESTITEVLPLKRMVLADAIIRNGKVLTLKGNGISVDVVVAIPDEKPLLFKDVTVESLKSADNSFCYNLIAPNEGVPYNRRQSFRCFVGNTSMLRSGGNLGEEYEVVIRDVSSTGFSITCDASLALPNNQMVHVLLEDYLEETDENFSFHLYGFVVRKQELEHGKVVYGCRLNSRVGGLENYLTKKERIRIKRNRGK